MSLPPVWKVKREIRRIANKLAPRVTFQFVDRLRQAHHDRNLARLLRETPGQLPLTGRVAVFVLFQPKGIAASTVLTLDHMAQERWSVLVVSNAPLSDADRTSLAQHSAHVIERPNTGYDFGAYREGWRWLNRNGHKPDRLILMNDSTWFPLRMQDDSLRRMEALNADLTGHIFKTEKANDKSHDHVEAHLLMLSPRALGHPSIRRFWSEYLMSNSKDTTISQGEKGITHAVRSAGLSVEGLLGRERLLELLSNLPDEALLQVVRDLALHNEAGRQKRADWLASAAAGKPWREDFLAWTSHELSNSLQHLLSATFIVPAVRYGEMAFLKKARERRFQLARMALMRGIEAGSIPQINPLLTNEIYAAIQSWTPPQDWRANPNEKPRPLEL